MFSVTPSSVPSELVTWNVAPPDVATVEEPVSGAGIQREIRSGVIQRVGDVDRSAGTSERSEGCQGKIAAEINCGIGDINRPGVGPASQEV